MTLAAGESWEFDAVDRFYDTAQTLYDVHETLDEEQVRYQVDNFTSLWQDAYEEAVQTAASYLGNFEEGDSLARLRPFFIDESPDGVRFHTEELPAETETPEEALEKYFEAERAAVRAATGLESSYDVSVTDTFANTTVRSYVDGTVL
ncbi:MAG: hypothetical protein SV186_04055 [Candidatus Nanohaloarchaea archaeon]|nr:hypothetical protein [Candidatus Nanohaloarchaea archaeon]